MVRIDGVKTSRRHELRALLKEQVTFRNSIFRNSVMTEVLKQASGVGSQAVHDVSSLQRLIKGTLLSNYVATAEYEQRQG